LPPFDIRIILFMLELVLRGVKRAYRGEERMKLKPKQALFAGSEIHVIRASRFHPFSSHRG
jgi:hypothetical protein